MISRSNIKQWFKTGLKPTQAHFWHWLDSYWHQQDKIPTSSIDGLGEALNQAGEMGVQSVKGDGVDESDPKHVRIDLTGFADNSLSNVKMQKNSVIQSDEEGNLLPSSLLKVINGALRVGSLFVSHNQIKPASSPDDNKTLFGWFTKFRVARYFADYKLIPDSYLSGAAARADGQGIYGAFGDNGTSVTMSNLNTPSGDGYVSFGIKSIDEELMRSYSSYISMHRLRLGDLTDHTGESPASMIAPVLTWTPNGVQWVEIDELINKKSY